MNYGHVNQPTNEEGKTLKRKKMIKIFVPVIVILIVVLLFASNNMSGIMGNYVCNYTCLSGWNLQGDKCVKNAQTQSFILGDVNKDNTVNEQDYVIIKQYINTKRKLSYIEKAVADINGDGEVNSYDIYSPNSSVDTGGEGEFNFEGKCPSKNRTEDYVDNGVKMTVNVVYTTKSQNQCNVMIAAIQTAKATCSSTNNTKPAINNNQNSSTNNNSSTSSGPLKIESKSCQGTNCNNNSTTQKYDNRNADVDDAVESDPDDAGDELENDVTVLNRESNNDKYLTNGPINNFKIYSVDNNTQAKISPDLVEYTVYSSKADCANHTNGTIVKKQDKLISRDISTGDKQLSVTNNDLYVSVAVSNGSSEIYVSQTKIDNVYTISQDCKKVENGKDIVFTTIGQKKNTYTLTYDNTNAGIQKASNSVLIQKKEVVKLTNNYNNPNGSFVGWTIYNQNNDYLCYNDINKTSTAWMSEKKCTNGKFILENGQNLSDAIIGNTAIRAIITLKAEYKNKVTINVNLKNSRANNVYKKRARIYVYNNKAMCEANLKKEIPTDYVKKAVYKGSKTGTFNFTRNLHTSKKYYLLATPTDFYNRLGKKNNCLEVVPNKTYEYTFEPKTFNVKFASADSKISVKKSKLSKTVDVDVAIDYIPTAPNDMKKTFAYWTISRVNRNGETEYRCYNNAHMKGWYTKSACNQYIAYNSNLKGLILKVNSYNKDGLTLIANWKSIKTVNVSGKIEKTLVDRKVLTVSDKIMQDLSVDSDGNIYVSQDNYTRNSLGVITKNSIYIKKYSSAGSSSDFVSKLSGCGHDFFEISNDKVITNCIQNENDIIYQIDKKNKKSRIEDVNPKTKKNSGYERIKLDLVNNKALVRVEVDDSKRYFKYYDYNPSKNKLSHDHVLIRLRNLGYDNPKKGNCGLDGQGYDVYDDKIYMYIGEGRGTGKCKIANNVAYVYVYSAITGDLLQINKIFEHNGNYEEPEGISVVGDYVYLGSGTTGRNDGNGGTKYANVYRIKKTELY